MLPLYFRGLCKSLAAISLLALMCANALGDDGACPDSRGTYVGVFGGGGASYVNSINQVGTAFFLPAAGGPLFVNAVGGGNSQGVGIVGMHIGREGSGRSLGAEGWALLPAAEFEGFYMGGTQRANVIDPTNRLNGHTFATNFPMDNGVFLTNVLLSLRTPSELLSPYAGAGIGAACVTISGADSLQTAPPEPGVNHFNSNPNASSWGFAAQAKVGLRVFLTQRCYLFTEYRFLYVGSTNYTFGPTVFPGHVPTTPWSVHFGDMFNHMAVGGIGISF